LTESHRCNPAHNQASKGAGDGWFKSKTKNVKAHKSLRGSCRVCGQAHSKNSHRQHLKTSFKKTHKYKKVFCSGKKAQRKGKERKIRFRDKVKDVARYTKRK
jgi:hypothetical protein